MLLDLRSLWEGPPSTQPVPVVVVEETVPSAAGTWWVGDRRLRVGEQADEQFLECLILDEES